MTAIRKSSGERRFRGKLSRDYQTILRGIPHLGEMDRVAVRALREVQPVAAADGVLRVLEIGCGTGRATAKLLTARRRLHLTALDNEPQLIQLAYKNLGAAVREGCLTLVESDALTYLKSAPSASMDAVVSVLCLHNFEATYRDKVLREIRRVLRPGGLFVNCDKYPPSDPAEFSRQLRTHMTLFLDAIAASGDTALLKQLVLHELADMAPERIMYADKALQKMTRLGFRDARFVYRSNLDAVLVAHRANKGV